MGFAGALAILAAALVIATYNRIIDAGPMEDEVLVTLGAAPQRLEPPPENIVTTEDPVDLGERADDAPPPAPPEQPRQVQDFTQGTGAITSGTGAEKAPAPPPPPPKPKPPAKLDRSYVLNAERALQGRVHYPHRSLVLEETGVGILRVIVGRSGKVISAKLIKSSGYSRLDQEIERAALSLKTLDPLPAGYPEDTASANLRITFIIK